MDRIGIDSSKVVMTFVTKWDSRRNEVTIEPENVQRFKAHMKRLGCKKFEVIAVPVSQQACAE